MARDHAADILYRAVISRADGSFREAIGPYLKSGTAHAQITRRRRYWPTEAGRVEVGQVIWTPEGQEAAVELVATSELESLREDRDFLQRLRNAGVDNWEGYSFAFQDDEEDEG